MKRTCQAIATANASPLALHGGSGIVGGMDTITTDQFRSSAGVEDWQAEASGAYARFGTGDFATGARLFAAIADLAERANHHPDIDVRYSAVRVRLFTHSADGLTAKDAELAAEISRAARDLGVEADTDHPEREI